MLRQLVDKYGARQVVLGTDYPYDMGMYEPVKHIGAVPGLSAADRALIMGGNAARLLKIKR
jgi:aminocarboxymuconate-semialdehyde decarboxylase